MVSNPACYAYLLKALQWMLLCVQYAWIYYLGMAIKVRAIDVLISSLQSLRC